MHLPPLAVSSLIDAAQLCGLSMSIRSAKFTPLVAQNSGKDLEKHSPLIHDAAPTFQRAQTLTVSFKIKKKKAKVQLKRIHSARRGGAGGSSF